MVEDIQFTLMCPIAEISCCGRLMHKKEKPMSTKQIKNNGYPMYLHILPQLLNNQRPTTTDIWKFKTISNELNNVWNPHAYTTHRKDSINLYSTVFMRNIFVTENHIGVDTLQISKVTKTMKTTATDAYKICFMFHYFLFLKWTF